MQIVDGFHRVAAALNQGLDSVKVQFVDGPADLAFIAAVRANVTHGLPLSLADRRAAATRIIGTHAHWSDRVIAEITGLSAKTVCGIRSKSGGPQNPDARLGKDGRLRPVNPAASRALVAELIKAKPEATLREIAAEAGVSPNTVRAVRDRLRGSECGITVGSQNLGRSTGGRPRLTIHREMATDVAPLLDILARDPTLRMNAEGRKLLRWLHLRSIGPDAAGVFDPAPAHCLEHLIELAKRCAVNWGKVASDLEEAHRSRIAI
ncbi:hypothetical protein [Mycobacterium sp. 1245852.3]|uniref:hypothetical protein n=1 Tax=Mycobacterium sp. 1245852.3 TaxID=1856860 RepID=UPI001E490195|nr:hypothetical protein [Mycobacterium sp. 1245852.3]